jgi:uncharacterized membrane protein
MDIGWFRDLVICISGVVVIIVLIFVSVLSYSVYHRTRRVLDSIEGISATIDEVITHIRDKVVQPAIQIAALVQGIRQGIDAISRLFKKQEGGGDG